MSTLDSQLLALSSMMTRDIYIVYIRPEATLREQTFVGKIFIVILAIIAFINAAIFGEMPVMGFQVDIIPKSRDLGIMPVVPIVVICSLIIVVFCRE